MVSPDAKASATPVTDGEVLYPDAVILPLAHAADSLAPRVMVDLTTPGRPRSLVFESATVTVSGLRRIIRDYGV